MSPELETLDQLASGDLPISVIRSLFEDDNRFIRGITAMLAVGEIRLLDTTGESVPEWRWRDVLISGTDTSRLVITDKGARRNV